MFNRHDGARAQKFQQAKSFWRERSEWVLAISKDRSLTMTTKVLAPILGEFFNSKTKEAWPSIARLADLLGRCERTITELLKQLEKAGYLTITRGCGRGVFSIYRMVFPGGEPVEEAPAQEPPTPVSGRVKIMRDAPEWATWARGFRLLTGKTPPPSNSGGWYFPIECQKLGMTLKPT